MKNSYCGISLDESQLTTPKLILTPLNRMKPSFSTLFSTYSTVPSDLHFAFLFYHDSWWRARKGLLKEWLKGFLLESKHLLKGILQENNTGSLELFRGCFICFLRFLLFLIIHHYINGIVGIWTSNIGFGTGNTVILFRAGSQSAFNYFFVCVLLCFHYFFFNHFIIHDMTNKAFTFTNRGI